MRTQILILIALLVGAVALAAPHVHHFAIPTGRWERCPDTEKLAPVACCECGRCAPLCD